MNELKTIPSHMITEEMRANGINEGSEYATREDMVNAIGIELVEQIEAEAIESTDTETDTDVVEETTVEDDTTIEEKGDEPVLEGEAEPVEGATE